MKTSISIPLAICITASALAGFLLFRSSPLSNSPYAAADVVEVAPVASPVPSAATLDAATIDIANFAFAQGIAVLPGQTVTVENIDGAPHTLTATDGAFDTDTIVANGKTSFVAPNTPGTYSFFCQIHPAMQGSLTVTG